MSYFDRIPDHFNERPNVVKSATLINNECYFDRNSIESTPFTLTADNQFSLKITKPSWSTLKQNKFINFSTEYLAPSFKHRIYIWFSEYQNSFPVGATVIGQVKTAPIIIDITEKDNEFIISTQSEVENTIRLDKGDYYLNTWYYGSSKGVYLNREFKGINS